MAGPDRGFAGCQRLVGTGGARAPHHAVAAAYWQQVLAQGGQLWFCRVTWLGLLRLLCQPRVMGEGALTLAGAWQVVQDFRAVPGVGLLAEPSGCDTHLARLLQREPPLPHRMATDAYLAAVAQAGNLRMVSFDADFRRFELAQCLILSGA